VKPHNAVTLRGRVATDPAGVRRRSHVGFMLHPEPEVGVDFSASNVPIVASPPIAEDVLALVHEGELVRLEGELEHLIPEGGGDTDRVLVVRLSAFTHIQADRPEVSR
jgi:hypothetical protein